MSYEKVKCITRKAKENKIFITSACNNIRPLTYRRWEFMANEQDYQEKLRQLVRCLNGGGLVLNDSCYELNYALMKTNEEMKAKYGSDFDIYNVSEMQHTIYVVGIPYCVSDRRISITQEEIDNDDFVYTLIYESKDGTTKEYYRNYEYIKERERLNTILDEYVSWFEKYLDEKISGKYYLYNSKYKYVKMKSNAKFYCSPTSSLITEKDLMDYKQAYCKAQIVGWGTEVREVPKREYAPTKEQLSETKKRLEYLKLDVNGLYVSNKYGHSKLKDFDLISKVNDFEKEYNCFVYYITYTNTEFGELYSMLYVSNYEEEWQDDFELLESNRAYAYVLNASEPLYSEIGSIGFIKMNNNGNYLVRSF